MAKGGEGGGNFEMVCDSLQRTAFVTYGKINIDITKHLISCFMKFCYIFSLLYVIYDSIIYLLTYSMVQSLS